VELEQVERLQPGHAQARLETGPDVVAGEGLGRVDAVRRGPDPVLRRHLGRYVERIAAVLADDLADDALALPVTPGGVDEVHAEFDRPVQGADGFVLLRTKHPDPPMPHAPYPISETDRPVFPSGRLCTLPPEKRFSFLALPYRAPADMLPGHPSSVSPTPRVT
jgi:hypothetical protein